MYLKALRSAPRSVCMALSICATASTNVPFAISDGWNCSPKILNQRLAPLVLCPASNTHISVIKENANKSGVASLKYLHLTFKMTTISAVPKTRKML